MPLAQGQNRLPGGLKGSLEDDNRPFGMYPDDQAIFSDIRTQVVKTLSDN